MHLHANPVNWAKFRTYGLFVKNFGWGVGVFRPGGSVGDTYRPFESFGGVIGSLKQKILGSQ